MDVSSLFQKLGLALGLGLLVGLQRERTASALAGFRTFPIVTMLGTLAGILVAPVGWALAAAGLLAIAAFCVMGNVTRLRAGEVDPGLTTESALLLMYCLGVYLAIGPAVVAIVVGGVIAVLLQLKPQLHGMAKKITEKEYRGITQFVALALIILPLLPDTPLGPYGVLNPRKIWWVVVIITGINLASYLLYRLRSAKGGSIAAGLLGGLISSTATTVSFSRRSRTSPGSEGTATLVIMLAGTVVFARVLGIIGVTAPAHLWALAPPLLAIFGVTLLLSLALWWRTRRNSTPLPEQQNPTELKAALIFTAVFATVLVATAAAKEHLGMQGLYVVAALSGLTDMDAITISTTRLLAKGGIDPSTTWRLILVGALSNIVFKTAVVAMLGSRTLLVRVALCSLFSLLAGVAICVFWP